MPASITLTRYTQEGFQNINGRPAWLDTAKKAFNAMGADPNAFYLRMGQYNGRTKNGRNYIDRRSDQDRRRVYDIDIVEQTGERRSFQERRSSFERRQNWLRVTPFVSVCLDVIEANRVRNLGKRQINKEVYYGNHRNGVIPA